ncbi:MAG TPA: diguanylate cyclase, partial [Magnetococcales bacterium]|nr:diguanylate cyclase [Magnetococcales bacterium]
NAAHVAEKIICSLKEPFVILGQSCQIGVSIGMSSFPNHGTQGYELIQRADQAMYAVKNSGRNAFAFYQEHHGKRES